MRSSQLHSYLFRLSYRLPLLPQSASCATSCIPPTLSRSFACATSEGRTNGRDAQPLWAHLWTRRQERCLDVGRGAALLSPTSRHCKLSSDGSSSSSTNNSNSNSSSGSNSSSSSPTPSSRRQGSSESSRGRGDSEKGSQAAQGKQASQPSPLSSQSSRPSQPQSRGQSSDSGSKDSPSRAGSQGAQSKHSPSSSPSSSSGRSRPPSQPASRGQSSSSAGQQGKRAPPDLGSLLLDARTASTPVDCYRTVWQLGKRVQHDQQTRQRYTDQQLSELTTAADALTATLLGSTPSSSSKHAAAPFQQLNSMQLSLTVWGLAYLADCSSSIMTRQLRQLVDGIAVHAVRSSVMDRAGKYGCMHWSRLLYSTAKLGTKCQDSQPVQRLFDVAAQQFPCMLRQRLPCAPQSLSMTLWAFATAEYPGSLRGLVAEVASNGAQAMKGANSQPQEWSDLLWALGTLAERRVDLGERSSVDVIMHAGAASMAWLSRSDVQHYSKSLWGLAKAGCRPHDSITSKMAAAVAERPSDADPQALSNTLLALAKLATLGCSPDTSTVRKLAAALAECSSDAAPQALSNTLWALAKLATLGCNPGASIVSKLANTLAERSSNAKPQELSNTLWALATLGCKTDTSTVSKLAVALAELSSDAKPQALSNTLWALSELCWYDAVLYSKLAKGVLLKISDAPEAIGQHFSNSMLGCAQSCHFDSSVDALAEWGSQQSVHHWTVQEVSITLYAWAVLAATAGGDTPSMHKLAQHLFAEANRRGKAEFHPDPEWRRNMGKLFSAHQEALHVRLPGGGVSDAELFRLAQEAFEQNQQEVAKLQT